MFRRKKHNEVLGGGEKARLTNPDKPDDRYEFSWGVYQFAGQEYIKRTEVVAMILTAAKMIEDRRVPDLHELARQMVGDQNIWPAPKDGVDEPGEAK